MEMRSSASLSVCFFFLWGCVSVGEAPERQLNDLAERWASVYGREGKLIEEKEEEEKCNDSREEEKFFQVLSTIIKRTERKFAGVTKRKEETEKKDTDRAAQA